MMPNVSVIITTYNRAGYVIKAIESVLSQTYQNWELVIVDDGSSDQTQEVVQSYLAKDGKVRYVKQVNQGLSGARNTGISETSGNLIAFLDDDDWWLPEKLEKQVAFMEAHPEIGMSYTRLRIIRSINGRLDDSTAIPVRMATTFEEILDDSFIPASTAMIRRKCLEGMDWFKVGIGMQEDLELWLRFVQRWKIAALDAALTVMKKNDRPQMSRDTVFAFTKAIEAIQGLELTPEYKHLEHLKAKNCAAFQYRIGRTYIDEGNYLSAAKHFFLALATYPLVGLMVRRPEEQGLKLVRRIAKSYLAVPVCLAKGLLHGRR